jgi:putative oxidoreductase
MQSIINQFAPLVGRTLLSLIFLWSGFGKITGFAGTAGYMASKGLPMVEVLLVITIIIELVAAAMIIVGWKARLGATALFLWMIPVTVIFHAFWAVPAELTMFMKNLSIMGGLLMVMAFGSGPYSIAKR